MIHLPIILGVKVVSSLYRNRASIATSINALRQETPQDPPIPEPPPVTPKAARPAKAPPTGTPTAPPRRPAAANKPPGRASSTRLREAQAVKAAAAGTVTAKTTPRSIPCPVTKQPAPTRSATPPGARPRA